MTVGSCTNKLPVLVARKVFDRSREQANVVAATEPVTTVAEFMFDVKIARFRQKSIITYALTITIIIIIIIIILIKKQRGLEKQLKFYSLFRRSLFSTVFLRRVYYSIKTRSHTTNN